MRPRNDTSQGGAAQARRADRGVRPYGRVIGGAVCGGTHGSRPTTIFVGQGPCALPGVRKKPGRADVGIGPYGSATRGAMGGRPQGSPLRKRYKGCGEAGGVEPRPYGGVISGAVGGPM